MATMTILTPEEVAQRDQKPNREGRTGRKRNPKRIRIIEAYKAAIRDAAPGYGADVTLAPDDDKRQVRQNLKAAADELSIALDFRPIKDRTRMHFRFITPEERAAKPKQGGRPPKQRATESAASDGGTEQAQTTVREAAVSDTPPATPRKRRTRTAATAS